MFLMRPALSNQLDSVGLQTDFLTDLLFMGKECGYLPAGRQRLIQTRPRLYTREEEGRMRKEEKKEDEEEKSVAGHFRISRWLDHFQPPSH